jgi:hypothetical protein
MYSIILSASGELVEDGFADEQEAFEWLKVQYGVNPPEDFETWLRGFALVSEDQSFDWMRYRHGGDVAHDGWGDSGFEV